MDKQKLAESCIYLAQNIAQRYAKRGYNYDECLSSAYYILVKSAERYNPSVGTKFTTYFARSAFKSLLKEYFTGVIKQPHNSSRKLVRKNFSVINEYLVNKSIDDEYISLNTLNENEKEVIKQRYWEDKLFKNIGNNMNLTTQRVQQIHSNAIRKLRNENRCEKT